MTTTSASSSNPDLLTGWIDREQKRATASRRDAAPFGRGLRFAFYGRMSTKDFQDPASSYHWQREVALGLTAGRGTIVAEFFDIGYSRRKAWDERPQAAALLDALADPDRAFDAIVVGEYERAFHGNQLPHLAPTLERHGVQLWLPETDGPLDYHSPTHRGLVMMLGAQSKREVQRARFRVIAAMQAQAREQGRYLGGRPPYGYQLADAGPHPNAAHARWGRRLNRLEPDPATAPHVRWMFAQTPCRTQRCQHRPSTERDGDSLPVRRRPGPQPAPQRRRVDPAHGRRDLE
ncbi:recombinase family protein [Micromonospora rhizosphaerae]|uniref:recombinase family protein n=1 Tax=Micromonospora rhizosphaerae TaxID=568872 RepID=UPI000B2F4B30|nr:recombinase family protein [Micromonospora rhizosphaerae]